MDAGGCNAFRADGADGATKLKGATGGSLRVHSLILTGDADPRFGSVR